MAGLWSNLQKNRFFIISGPSGVGKTTTLKTLCDLAAEMGLQLHLPVKITTRHPKPSDNPAEMTYCSIDEFATLSSNNVFATAYERHGHSYGLLWKSLEQPPGTILLQSMPSAIAQILCQDPMLPVKIVTVRLRASALVIGARLRGRSDAIGNLERTSRERTAYKEPQLSPDYTLDAERPPIAIAQNLADIISTSISAPAPNPPHPATSVPCRASRARG